MPGGFSPLYARMAEMAGFESFFLAGSQVSAYLYGVPDAGIVGLRDMVDHARHVAAATAIPVLVDADTGYGNAINVYFAVQEFVRCGVAGIQIEDQEAPKRSGTSSGRRCLSIDEAVRKIQAAVHAKNQLDPDFVICARCDAIGAECGGFQEAVDRCTAYIQDAGADFVWLNTVQTRDDIAAACAAIPGPVMVLWGGDAPQPKLDELSRLGAKLSLYPVVAATVGMEATWQFLNDFRQDGPVVLDAWTAGLASQTHGRPSWDVLTRRGLLPELERRFLSADEQRDHESSFGAANKYYG